MLSRLLNWKPGPMRAPAPRGGAALDLPTGRPTDIPAAATALPTAVTRPATLAVPRFLTAPSAPAPRAASAPAPSVLAARDTFQPSASLEAIRQEAAQLMAAVAAPAPAVTPRLSTPAVTAAPAVAFTTPGLADALAALGALPTAPGPVAPVAAPAPPAPTRAVPYINQYHPDGEGAGYTNGDANCGPTSMAMIARALGYGAGMSDAKLVNHLGNIGGTTSDGTAVNGIVAMAKGIGATGEIKGPGADVAWIADQLRAGKLVVANGDYYAMGSHDRSKIGSGGHYVAVIGLDAQGNFLVNDPADTGIQGRSFTPDELALFIKSNTNGGYQIAVG